MLELTLLRLFLLIFLILPGALASDRETLLLNLEVNHSECSEILTADLTNNDLIFSTEELGKCGIHPPFQESFINLKNFSEVSYRLDKENLKAFMNVPVTWLKSNVYSADDSGKKNNIPTALYAMGINYDINANSSDKSINGLPEIMLFTPYGYANTGVLLKSKGSERITRLETYWVQENSEKMQRLRIGDSITGSSTWGGSARFAGVQWSTNFASQPNFITFPQVAIRGEAAMPTAIDVLANNTNIYQKHLTAGAYEIVDLPIVTGAGLLNLQMVDLLGNRQIISVPYYVSSDLLKPGLSSFSYDLGILRNSFGMKSNAYSQPILVLTHRQGFSDYYTAGWHGEVSKHHLLAGIDQTLLINKFGIVSLSTAANQGREKLQGLIAVSGERKADPVSFGGRLTYTTGKFQDISFIPSLEYRPKLSLQSFISTYNEKLGSITLSFTSTKDQKSEPLKLLTVNYQKQISEQYYFSASVNHQFKDKKNTSFFISFNCSFGDGKSALISRSQESPHQYHDNINFQQSMSGNLGTGYGLRASKESGKHMEYEAEVSNANPYSFIQGRSVHNRSGTYNQISASGGLIYIEKNLFATRKIYDSIGIVKIPSIENVEVYLNNSLIGATNGSGEVVLPNLLTFSESSIRLNEQNISMDTQLDLESKSIFVPFQGAYEVNFTPTSIFNQTMRILLPNKTPPEPGLIIEWSDGQSTIVGYDGEIYRSFPQDDQKVKGDLYTKEGICHIELSYLKVDQISVNEYPILYCKSFTSKPISTN